MRKEENAVQEWLRVHHALMEKEAAFSKLAMQVASGQASLESLDEERRALVELRAHCSVMYENAFPRSSNKPR